MTSSNPQISEPMMAAVMMDSCKERERKKNTAMDDLWNTLTLSRSVICHVKYHDLKYYYFNSSQPTMYYYSLPSYQTTEISVFWKITTTLQTIMITPEKSSLSQTYVT
jgi:hypothetical protein